MEMSRDRRKVHVCNSFPPSLSPPPLLPPTYASNKSVFVSSADYGAFVRAPHCQACWSQGLPLAPNMNLNKIDPYISQPKTDGCWITVELSRTPSLEIFTSKKELATATHFSHSSHSRHFSDVILPWNCKFNEKNNTGTVSKKKKKMFTSSGMMWFLPSTALYWC